MKILFTKGQKIIYSDEDSTQMTETCNEEEKAGTSYRTRNRDIKYAVSFEDHWYSDSTDCNSSSCSEADGERKSVMVKAFKKKMAHLGDSYCPIRCPLFGCKDSYFPDELLSHIFQKHTTDDAIERHGLTEIHNKQKVLLYFKETDLTVSRNVCVAFLLYDSIYKKGTMLPPFRSFGNGNTFLHSRHLKHKYHVPIMVMTSLMTWSDLLSPKSLKSKCKANEKCDQSLLLLVIWLTGGIINKPFSVTTTLFNKSMSHSKSTILTVVPIHETQKPCNFLRNTSNYLLLPKGELDILSNNGRHKVNIELIPTEEND
ncbi:uncharacterized protein LOC119689127 [Teleopsis dalmanni]|uniref:uncharacterized protein LOC119689127 n=1 Tax=Teleopsis dalmanni TaxID=139649 RepID=UPI0018CEA232|nr:uncharacterized protein LOC119689127 [Teleopsis dalmanni]